jgi:hypothetical protein
VNQRLIKSVITNSPKYQIGLHHCDVLVEIIEMVILFAYIRIRMKEIWKRQKDDAMLTSFCTTPCRSATWWPTIG